MTATGTLRNLWIKPAEGAPMEAVETAVVVAGAGIVGNADQGGPRQVTVLSADRWRRTEAEVGRSLDPSVRRANLCVSGIDLADTVGRVLRVGGVRLEIRGETRPCREMDAAVEGLWDALRDDWGGGAHGVALDDGPLSVGDPVYWEDAQD